MLPHKKNMHVLHSVVLVCFVVGLVLCAASAGYAQDRYKGEWILPEHYPDGFNGWGRIDRLGADEIVIHDLEIIHQNPYCNKAALRIAGSRGYQLPKSRDGKITIPLTDTENLSFPGQVPGGSFEKSSLSKTRATVYLERSSAISSEVNLPLKFELN